jgi:hypothetical protein
MTIAEKFIKYENNLQTNDMNNTASDGLYRGCVATAHLWTCGMAYAFLSDRYLFINPWYNRGVPMTQTNRASLHTRVSNGGAHANTGSS